MLIQIGVKLDIGSGFSLGSLRALLIQIGVKQFSIPFTTYVGLRALVLWSDRDTYKFLIFKVFMMNDILFMTQYAL